MKTLLVILSLLSSTAYGQIAGFMLTASAAGGGGGGGAVFKAITIDHTKVANTDQTNFPMSFDITANWIKSSANGGSVVNSTKNNIVLYADNAGATPLNYEIISWDASAGNVKGTVRIPTASHTSDVVIYISAGNASISTSQSPGSVWDANYLRVWHMDEVLTGAGQTIADWTTNAGNMTSVGSWTSAQSVAGIVGTGLKLLPSPNTYMTYSAIPLTSTWTIEGFYNPSNATVDDNILAFDHDPFSSPNDNEIAWGNPAGYAGLFTGSGTQIQSGNIGASPWLSGAWHHMAITRNGTALTLYIDGVSNATSANGLNVNFNTLGHDGTFTTNDLIVDELRVSTSVRSADWIATSYNNQSSMSTFYTVAP